MKVVQEPLRFRRPQYDGIVGLVHHGWRLLLGLQEALLVLEADVDLLLLVGVLPLHTIDLRLEVVHHLEQVGETEVLIQRREQLIEVGLEGLHLEVVLLQDEAEGLHLHILDDVGDVVVDVMLDG